MGATIFGLIRHAPTTWNAQKRIQGQSDSPLTCHGVARARQWGQMLKPLGWDKIVTSDLGRAAHTAALLNESLGLPIFHEPRLREQDWGQWTGLTLEVIMHENARELNRLLSAGWDFQPPGGESRQQVWQRGAAALRALAAIGPQTRVLVVAHGGLIRALTYRLLHRRFDPGEPALIEKRHLHLLRAQDGCLHLDRLNALRLP